MTFLTTEEAIRGCLETGPFRATKILTLKNNIMECFIENLENFEFANSEFCFYCPAHHVGKFRHLHVGYTDHALWYIFTKAENPGGPVSFPFMITWWSEDHRQTVVVALVVADSFCKPCFSDLGSEPAGKKFRKKSRFYHRTDSSSLDFSPHTGFWQIRIPGSCR